MKDKETKEFGREWQDEQREKMVRIQFPKTIQKIEQEAERRGYKRGLERAWEIACEQLNEKDQDTEELEIGELLIISNKIDKEIDKVVKLLEEENGKQNAR